jgi:hypothetical protein
MAPKLCNRIRHDNRTLKFWYFHSKKCLHVGKRHCVTLAEKPSILNTPTISELFFMLKYPLSTNTVHFSYYSKQKTRKLLTKKFEDYFSHSVSNTTFQQTTHNCKTRLPETFTFLTSFWILFILLLMLQATKVHMNMLQRPLRESDSSTWRHFFRSDLMW